LLARVLQARGKEDHRAYDDRRPLQRFKIPDCHIEIDLNIRHDTYWQRCTKKNESMKKYVYHLVLVFFPFYNTSMAQSSSSDAVYLKNGSIYWGTLVEQHKDSLVKIQIAGGSIIAVPHKELDHIERGVQQSAAMQSPDDTKSFSSTKGYFNITEMGVMPGVTLQLLQLFRRCFGRIYHTNDQWLQVQFSFFGRRWSWT
jgi:hypothetical protein